MSNIYRIYPTLWDTFNTNEPLTIYAIDRSPTPKTFPIQCSSRPKDDPASVWNGSTFLRLLPPPEASCGGVSTAVTWATLPSWISWIQTIGYSISGDLGQLNPFRDFYIVGP